MGRTNPTFRDYIDREEHRWSSFRRGLRRRSQADFDRLFAKARTHADAAGYANADDPRMALLLAVLVAQERELRELREEVESVDGPDTTGKQMGRDNRQGRQNDHQGDRDDRQGDKDDRQEAE